ncbi:MAG: hypothetical protein HY754_02205 [Nitrospirae bacterium]|nr:hypothetical protein [Nitrospirota bacterium]
MKARDIARANLSLNKIHAAVVEGLLDEKEIFEDKGFISLLLHIYKNRTMFPENLSVLLHDIRKALLERKITTNELTENLHLLLIEIRKRKQRKKGRHLNFYRNSV